MKKFPDDYQQMFANLQAAEPGVFRLYRFLPLTHASTTLRVNLASGGENVEYLDYVVVSSEYAAKAHNDNRVMSQDFQPAVSYGSTTNPSDHFPVSAVIK